MSYSERLEKKIHGKLRKAGSRKIIFIQEIQPS